MFALSVGSLALLVTLAAAPAPAPPMRLRVCADPNNMPFSNQRGEGLENALARLVAQELGAELTYVWLPQRRGFVRQTLGAGACDVMMEAPVPFARAAVTRPYYRSSYAFVFRRDRSLRLHSLDDPALRRMRIAVSTIGDDYANTPPAEALARRGLITNLVGVPVYGDYGKRDPQAAIVEAVASGAVDVAIVWGPTGAWFASRVSVPLNVVPIGRAADDPPLPLAFDIGMAVRRDDTALRDRLDRLLTRAPVQRRIAGILADFHIPLLPLASARVSSRP
ncbi:MAG TPA: quinoprotein dehydrogenase-associated putative ABC transporter substrate-binding protein [Polyangia bacterium]|jgi:mxaJ protein|nr:quinoprotein dehydrogenase-associated putative ABC transporter substrate-binding protein [Polyangia bacterium]